MAVKEISDNERKQIKSIFSSWLELNDNKGEITKEMKDLKEEVAVIFDVKPARITKLFATMKTRLDEENNVDSDIDELYTMAVELGI